ncbi:hypothetical protein AYR66_03845 [Noviherbaspirillum denitrificans]|uniref:6-phosphogluconolactonase n=1 Tax=Noviherbaspirillum denitrificans TaxID=1968433 RepID=A0A254T8D8_9BURK|nr:hypothetical protein AYR66_03845 [Noviherbaspirillum denitrificans]
MDFKGRALVLVSDADMLASAYVNGELGPREGTDALSVIPLGAPPRELKAFSVPVSNSVAGPPVAVATTPDGRFAIVVETFGQRPDNNERHHFGDLKHGNQIAVVDVSDLQRPRVVQRVTGLERPDSVSVNAAGNMIAVALNPQGAGGKTPLALYEFRDGRLGPVQTPQVPGWALGERLIHAEFHPSSNLLALVNETRGELSFVTVGGSPGARTLEALGNKVQVERAPYMARFTPDGRHVLVNALYWGPDIQGTWNEAPRGSVVSVRLHAGKGADGSTRHALVSRAVTGVSPEGLAISPDGKLVATANLERSFLPYDDPRITWYSSVSLFRLDQDTGQLQRVADYAYDGILPEALAFDASGNYLAVVTFDHFDDSDAGGSVDFWRIARDSLDAHRVELVMTPYRVKVQRGPHSMVLVR